MTNLATVTRARDCVFGVDDSQLAFVKHHFGEAPTTPRCPTARGRKRWRR